MNKYDDDAAYDKVLEAARVASAAFREAQKQYRSRKIGDAEFLAARALFDATGRDLDIARGELGK